MKFMKGDIVKAKIEAPFHITGYGKGTGVILDLDNEFIIIQWGLDKVSTYRVESKYFELYRKRMIWREMI